MSDDHVLPSLTRREVLAAAGAGATLVALGGPLPATGAARRIDRRRLVRGGTFAHGVAAGVPRQRAVTLWTRLGEVGRTATIGLEIARDRDFRRVVHRERVRAVRWRDMTAKRTVHRGLAPGEEYFYRWFTRDETSGVGRFRTARPADSQERVRIGFFSCQNYAAGYFTALRALAEEDDLDLTVCLGDYIYERTGRDEIADRRDTTGANRDSEVQTLPEYREKYRLYRTDRDLQALHARHPFVAIWDDHEFENDYAGDTPSPNNSNVDERRLPYLARRRDAYNAFFEYMPRVRFRPEPSRIYGSIPLGGMAELLMLDTRQYRDPQPCEGRQIQPCEDNGDPGRTLLGDAQKRWLKGALRDSPAAWKVVANQVMMMSLDSVPSQALNTDQWDGYAAERQEVLADARAGGVEDVAVITGDIHTFFAGQVTTSGRIGAPAAATEFVGGAVTSGGLEEEFGEGTTLAEQGVPRNNPHIVYAELKTRGFGLLEATASELKVEFRGVRTVKEPDAPVETLARFRVPRGEARVERL